MSDLFGGQRVRTLGIYQPFAGLMLHEKIETRWLKRGRKAPFPLGWYVLYATKKIYTDQQVQEISGAQYGRIRDLMKADKTHLFNLTGHAICIGQLSNVLEMGNGDPETTFVKWHHDDDPEFRMVGLYFRNVQRIMPFAITGKQGIGFLTAADRSKIRLYDKH